MSSIGIDRCTYVALHLDRDSQAVLRGMAERLDREFGYRNARVICHHMTIAFRPRRGTRIYDWCRDNIGREFTMKVVRYGVSDKANAVMVETDCPSANRLKHVTLSVHPDFGGKPVDSNYIEDWSSIASQNEILLRGTVECFR